MDTRRFVLSTPTIPAPPTNPPDPPTFDQLKRSLGSGFDLVELKVQHPSAHDSCPPGTSSISMGSRSLDENDSYGELPPEDDWRDGLFQCFSVFFPIGTSPSSFPMDYLRGQCLSRLTYPPTYTGAMACFGTSVAQVQVMKELRWTAGSKCQSGLLLAVVAMLWLSVPVSFFFGLYLLGAGAVALVLLLEAYVAFRLRLVTRRRYDIEGSAVRDCLVSTLCTSCVTAQILRHLKGGGE